MRKALGLHNTQNQGRKKIALDETIFPHRFFFVRRYAPLTMTGGKLHWMPCSLLAMSFLLRSPLTLYSECQLFRHLVIRSSALWPRYFGRRMADISCSRICLHIPTLESTENSCRQPVGENGSLVVVHKCYRCRWTRGSERQSQTGTANSSREHLKVMKGNLKFFFILVNN
ncbi:hypothetical protein BGZ63DRAFT_261591 [Mariannaea sp. PMI_226]|nr:hypothetical protein BGZ63DRAFT_261591 [Mariannaea sp. PMI_226]